MRLKSRRLCRPQFAKSISKCCQNADSHRGIHRRLNEEDFHTDTTYSYTTRLKIQYHNWTPQITPLDTWEHDWIASGVFEEGANPPGIRHALRCLFVPTTNHTPTTNNQQPTLKVILYIGLGVRSVVQLTQTNQRQFYSWQPRHRYRHRRPLLYTVAEGNRRLKALVQPATRFVHCAPPRYHKLPEDLKRGRDVSCDPSLRGVRRASVARRATPMRRAIHTRRATRRPVTRRVSSCDARVRRATGGRRRSTGGDTGQCGATRTSGDS